MSDKDSEKPLDLSSLQLAPDWVSSLDSGSTPNYKELENVDYTERKGGKGRGKGGGPGRNRPGGGGDRRGQGGPGGDRRGPGGAGGGDRRGPGGAGGGDRRGQGGGQRREGQSQGGGDRRGQGGQGGGDRRREAGGGGRDQRGGDRRQGGRFGNRDRQPLETPPGLAAKISPNAAGIKALAQTIKRSGRTFGLIDIAKLIVAGRERYDIVISPSAKKNPDAPAPKLTRCKTDNSLWLSHEEAVRHVIDSGIIEKKYAVEQVQTDPPKGNFSGIAICGMSGTLLGPPNHHSYLENVLKLHRERFSSWNLERYKARIRIESGEEIVEKWKTEQSTRTEWVFPKPAEAAAEEPPAAEQPDPAPAPEATATPAEPAAENAPAETTPESEAAPTSEAPAIEQAPAAEVPATEEAPAADQPTSEEPTSEEPTTDAPTSDTPTSDQPTSDTPASEQLRFTKRADLERHARETFVDAVLEDLDSATIPGNIPGKLLSPLLLNLVKSIGEHSRRSPAVLIAPLCDLLGEHGLKFFRWGGKQLFTSATRPRQLNSDTPMGTELRAIFDFVRANPNTKPQALLDRFAPSATPEPAPEAKSEGPAPEAPAEVPPTDKPTSDPPTSDAPTSDKPTPDAPTPDAPTSDKPTSDKPTSDAPAPAPETPSLTPQQITVLKHLRWLVGEGYIIEFADGRLDAVRVRTVTPESKAKPAAAPTESKPTEPAAEKAAPPTDPKPAEPAAATTPAASAPAPTDSPSPDPVSEHQPDPGLTPQTDPDLPADPGLPTDLEP